MEQNHLKLHHKQEFKKAACDSLDNKIPDETTEKPKNLVVLSRAGELIEYEEKPIEILKERYIFPEKR